MCLVHLFKWVGVCLQGGARVIIVSFEGGVDLSYQVLIFLSIPVMFIILTRTISSMLSLNYLPLRSCRKVLDGISRIMVIGYTCCLLMFHYFVLVLVRHLLTVEDISGS